MAIQHAIDHEMTVLDQEREWGVQRCSHGCVHITLDRLTLTFTEVELFALSDLLHKACEGLLQAGTPARVECAAELTDGHGVQKEVSW